MKIVKNFILSITPPGALRVRNCFARYRAPECPVALPCCVPLHPAMRGLSGQYKQRPPTDATAIAFTLPITVNQAASAGSRAITQLSRSPV